MKVLKKIFSITIILSLIITPLGYLSANLKVDENIIIKKVISSRINLQSTITWKIYIEKIDKIITKIKSNEQSLKNLETKINEIKNKLLTSQQTANTKKIISIINYLEAKVKLELYRLSISDWAELKNELEKKLEEIKNSSLSEQETIEVNEKLIKIQLNLLENINNKLWKLTKDFENISSYEEKGDFKFDLNLKHELIWRIKANLELNDYELKNSDFDAKFLAKIKAAIDVEQNWVEPMKLKMESFIDFISKDSNIYLLLSELNITDEAWNETIKWQLDLLKKIAEKNKYIKIEDKNSKQVLDLIKNINPSKIISDGKKIMWEPIFRAYKKEWDRYSLVPSKYACDKFKELSAKFDPFNGSNCSESQYENMIKSLADNGDLYLEVWNNENKLGFEMKQWLGISSFNSYIIFTDTSVEELKSELIAKNNEGFLLEYTKNSNLNFSLDAWDTNIILESDLNKYNDFSSAYVSINLERFAYSLDSEIKYQDNKISGTTIINDMDWDDFINISHIWKYIKNYLELNNNINFTISPIAVSTSWYSQDAKNSKVISDLRTIVTSIEIKLTEWTIQFKDLMLENNKINFVKLWQKEEDFKNPSWEDYLIFIKEETYNGNKYEVYLVYWTTIDDQWNIVAAIKWSAFDDRTVTINWKTVKSWDVIWKIEIKEDNKLKGAEWNLNIMIDTRYNKNNSNLYIDYVEWEDKILELELDNKSSIKYKEINIEAPTNTVEINEVFR